MEYVLGIDGCRAGWVICTLPLSRARPHLQLVSSLNQIGQLAEESKLTVIDMPIGLPDLPSRTADRLARSILKEKRSTVFSPPTRFALSAKNFELACARNRTKVGKAISLQAFYIGKKIRELDIFLRSRGSIRERCWEMHPELTFWALTGKVLLSSKKEREGRNERLGIIERHSKPLARLLTLPNPLFPASQCAKDDLIDAAVLALAARVCVSRNQIFWLGDENEQDRFGLTPKLALPPTRFSKVTKDVHYSAIRV